MRERASPRRRPSIIAGMTRSRRRRRNHCIASSAIQPIAGEKVIEWVASGMDAMVWCVTSGQGGQLTDQLYEWFSDVDP